LSFVALGLGASAISLATGLASQEPPDADPESTKVAASATTVYRAACLQCHDNNGQGQTGRDTFPSIPDFTNPAWHTSRSDEDLRRAILRGKGQMKPMKKKLGSVNVMHMVSFVRSFQGGGLVVLDEPEKSTDATPEGADTAKPAEAPRRPVVSRPPGAGPISARSRTTASAASPSPKAVPTQEAAGLYRKLCLDCHGQDGRGNDARESMPTIPDFTAKAWQWGRDDHRLTTSILDGRGVSMPAWHGKISAKQARELVSFVRSLGPSVSLKTTTAASEFGIRFRELQAQWEELDEQARALTNRP
jgi:mono/diheme cytochrome c family protein